MTKQEQYNEYVRYGGTMTIEEWEQDGRYDKEPCPFLVIGRDGTGQSFFTNIAVNTSDEEILTHEQIIEMADWFVDNRMDGCTESLKQLMADFAYHVIKQRFCLLKNEQ